MIEEEITDFTYCQWNLTAANCPTAYNALKKGKSVLLTIYNPTFINNR